MNYVRFALVIVNAAAFIALMVMSIRFGRRETYVWVRRMWLLVALACGALVLGSVQRFALQAVSVGWLPESVSDAVTSDFQLIQSLIVLLLVVGAFVTLKRLAASIEASERMTATLIDRVRHIDPGSLNLTKRESEVLELIGQGVTTDAGLASELHISTSTVQTHVKSLLRKSKLNNRNDLVAVAVLVSSHG